MKARLFLDTDGEMKILCQDGTIAVANDINLSNLLRNFKFANMLTGELGRWDNQAPSMFSYKPEQETYAFIQTDDSLIINNFKPFSVLFETTDLDMDDLISVPEYAESVGKSIEQIKVYLRQGRIPNSKKIGRDWIIHKSSINKYPLDMRISNGTYSRRKN